MAGEITVSVTGLTELINTFQALPEALRQPVADAVSESTADALEVARANTPVDTGYLQSRWQVQWSPGLRTFAANDLFNDARYAAPVFLGHHTRSGSFVPPQDAVTPAIEAGRRSLEERLQALAQNLPRAS